MTEPNLMFVLETEGEIDPDIGSKIEIATGTQVRTIEKHGLAGDVSSWLLVGNFVVSSLAVMIPLVTAYLKERRVKSIKLGDLVIENPTPEHVATVLKNLSRQSRSQSKNG